MLTRYNKIYSTGSIVHFPFLAHVVASTLPLSPPLAQICDMAEHRLCKFGKKKLKYSGHCMVALFGLFLLEVVLSSM